MTQQESAIAIETAAQLLCAAANLRKLPQDMLAFRSSVEPARLVDMALGLIELSQLTPK